MAQGNKELSAKLNKAGAAMVPAAFESNVKSFYAQNRKRILALVGGDEQRAALYIASAFAECNKLPELLNCTPESFYHCLILSMGTSLLPGPMAECHFIPFKNNNKTEATFIPGYQGLVKLAYNSGFVRRISGHIVWEADEFEYNPATEEIYHRPFQGPEKDRGKRIGAYVVIKNRFGEPIPTYKTAEFIEGIKARSRGAKSSFSPWNSKYPSDVDAMWLKTVFKQAAKWIPKASNQSGLLLGRAIEVDNSADTGEPLAASLLSDDVKAIEHDIMGVQAEAKKPDKKEKREETKHPEAEPMDFTGGEDSWGEA